MFGHDVENDDNILISEPVYLGPEILRYILT
jgi:hypothetical protein